MSAVGPFTKFSAESPPFNPNQHPSQQQQNQQQQSQHQQHLHTRTNSNNGGNPYNGGLSPNSRTTPSSYGGSINSNQSSNGTSRSNSPYPYNNNNGNNNNNDGNIGSSNNIPASTTSTSTSAAIKNSNAVPSYSFQYGDKKLEIRNVWIENVEEEMANIREIIELYPYVAMDTEFPGIVAKPVITENYTPDYHYKSLKVNVDLLKIIQLGLSFANASGQLAHGCPCWQFNFKFNLDGDMFAQDSIDLLTNSGISFHDHAKRGIDPLLFGELLMVSGLVLDDRVKWISFHSGYDYGYLLKLLTTVDLPNDEKTFFELLKIYFPTIYDVKYMTSLLDGHYGGGLSRLADDLQCIRLGVEHQAGSDSLLTMSTFFALIKSKFHGKYKDPNDILNSPILYDNTKFVNELFGYGTNHTARKSAIQQQQLQQQQQLLQLQQGIVGVGSNMNPSLTTYNNNTRDTSGGSVFSSGSND